jgi:parvulin-like peptidyl-prolyl isomerase
MLLKFNKGLYTMKKTLKLFSISLLFGFTTSFGGLVDAISIVVDGEPITLYEIYKLSKKSGLPKEKAVEYLIKERLKDKELKRLSIVVDDFDVNQEIERIAQQNGIDSLKLREIIVNRGMEWDKYKQTIKEKLQQQRLYKKILSTKIEQPSEETLKEYYQLNIEKFSIPKEIDVIQYSATTREALQKIMQNPMATISGVTQQAITIKSEKLNQQLLFMLTNTQKGSFTQIIPVNGKFVTFFIQDFIDQKPIPYEDAREKVYAKWMEEKRKEAIESHFEKLRSAANIKILRTP